MQDNQVSSNTTTATLSGLQFNLVAGTTYHYQFNIPWRTGVASCGLRLGLLFPAATMNTATVMIPISTTGTGYMGMGNIAASGGSITGTSALAANTTYLAQIFGVITPSSNGTLHTLFSGEVATASGITVMSGAHGLLWSV
jgi:hypothetical protein